MWPEPTGVAEVWGSGDLRTGNGEGGTSRGNLPFTLYLMDKTTGFSDDDQGTKYYINMCKEKGLLQVSCGVDSFNCDKDPWYGEPCLPMPKTWGCNVMGSIKTNTGWGDNIVAFQGYRSSNSHLYKPAGASISKSQSIHAVCGQVTGMPQLITV